MKRHRHQGRRKGRRIVGLVLFTLVFLPTLLCAPPAGLFQESGGSPAAALATNPANPGASSASQATRPQLAPDASRWPFLRLVAVLCLGLVINAARLARKFRRFWGLGVFTNLYAVLFLIFGVALCGIPVTSESALSSLPHLGSLGRWIADLSGIILTLILPAIRLKPEARPAGGSQVRDLEDGTSSSPILAVIEDAIRDRILERMQLEVVAASRRYDWDTIKLAARRALEEEMTVRPLGSEEYDAVCQSIESFQADADSRLDSNNKYTALLRLLRWCSFKRLRRGLDAAARETQS
jgi:hypothetical protein